MKTFLHSFPKRSRHLRLLVPVLILLLMIALNGNAETIRYVKKTATGTGDGTSWENAYTELGDALKWAGDNKSNWENEPLRIYVAKGIYKPMYKVAETDLSNVSTTERDNAFMLVKNVQLYGGFDPENGIIDLADRCLVDERSTVLSGDLAGNDAADVALGSLLAHASRTDNVYHVVLGIGDTGSACIDGFTISGGNGDKDGLAVQIKDVQVYRGFGAGMSLWYAAPAIRHVIIKENATRQSGGGLYTYASTPQISWTVFIRNASNQGGGGMMEYYSESRLTNVRFENNWARSSGGGLSVMQYAPKLTNVVFTKNATDVYGGAIYHYQCSPQYVNVIITGNRAGDRGGAVYNAQSTPKFTNVTITGNTGVYYTAGIYNYISSAKFVNSVIWNNKLTSGVTNNVLNLSGAAPEYQNCIVQGSGGSTAWKSAAGTDKGANLDIDPMFADVAGGDYSPADVSPMINAGSNTLYTNAGGDLLDKDVAGFPRVTAAGIDMGAYQTVDQSAITVRYVRPGFTGKGQSWEHASGDLQAMINASAPGHQIWVARGTFSPNRMASAPGTITPNDPENAFILKNAVKIYGGFAGCETDPGQRNMTRHESVLSGDLGSGVAVYHAVMAIGSDVSPIGNATLLDGFTITAAHASNNGAGMTVNGHTVSHGNGGGIYAFNAAPIFKNIKVAGNRAANIGGGIFNWSSDAKFENLVVTGNAGRSGGGIANYQGLPSIVNARVSGNAATWGGGVYNLESPSDLTGLLISGNVADYGGGMYNASSSPTITHATIASNTAHGIYNTSNTSAPKLRNSILYGNALGIYAGTVTQWNSLVQGVSEGGDGNLDGDIDPMFVNLPAAGQTTAGDFSLQACSWMINAGNSDWATGVGQDLAGNGRLFGKAVDLGAFEYQSDIQTGAERLALNTNANSVLTENDKTYRVTTWGDNCRSMAFIKANGSAPVTGEVSLTTWVDESIQYYKSAPYVQRHYDVSPVTNAETATATVTLYFTQQEFNAFNATAVSGKIPSGPEDASGKSQLRVYQYHGQGNGGNTPAAYEGRAITIDPADDQIVWNNALERWEVTFAVNGFSGFFAGSESSPLPVKLISFTGRLNDQKITDLIWKVTEQQNIMEYVVEYSSNARDFSEVGRLQASTNSDDTYRFQAVHAFTGNKAYYRLHILEADTDAYSRIISLNAPEEKKPIIYPMPAREFVWLKGPKLSGAVVQLLNVQGTVVKTIQMKSDDQRIDIASLPAGIYLLQLPFGGIQKVVKQ